MPSFVRTLVKTCGCESYQNVVQTDTHDKKNKYKGHAFRVLKTTDTRDVSWKMIKKGAIALFKLTGLLR